MAAARRAAAAGAGLLALAAASAVGAPLFAPYQDVSLGLAPGAPPRIARMAWEPARPAWGTLIWAFATGECGQERWGDFDSAEFARLSRAQFEAAGLGYILATGGQAGAFTCASDEAMEAFIARHDSPLLRGLDFDIEGSQSAAQIEALVLRAQAAQRRRPQLRISFTLATHAAVDGSRRSLNATGEQVLRAIQAVRFDSAIINLMVMNYGPADRRWCLPRQGRCDMGRSALQALRNVHLKYGIPYARLAVTPMLGENDVAGNVFSLADARRLRRDARSLGLAGVHFWSLSRDQPCLPGQPRVSPQCHGLGAVAPGAFTRALR